VAEPLRIDADYQLEHRYLRERGRVYLTGVQALVRLPLEQRRRDLARGWNTAGFISGYRGSPLGTYDLALWQAKDLLEAHQVHFQPGVNEDLAATAVWGSQQANLLPGARHDGVFAIWYGKGPGVDRSCDALKHGNYAGTSPRGGVLVLCGDDPAARSSSIAHQSEHALIHCGIPVLNPASVQDYLDLGLAGFALSRFSGCWVAMKCLTDTVDSARSVEVGPERGVTRTPDDFTPAEGLHIGWANIPLAVERRLFRQRMEAVRAFVRASGLDRRHWDGPRRRLGIVAAGKTFLDVREALAGLGIDEERARILGLTLYQVAMTWPLEPEGALRFAEGLEDLLVVEEKRAVMEDQLARLLYNRELRPRLLGKSDESGATLVPSEGELAPDDVAACLRGWLARRVPELASELAPRTHSLPGAPGGAPPASGLVRLPSFCAGCPHNGSTVVPEDSLALGGIGCHGMAVWIPERRTLAVTQMGGEGANWIGAAPFTDTPHLFQNMGDGTYFHSGLLAIRAAVTAGVNVTYKILVNGAVAMTGGQPIEGEPLEGEVTVPEIAAQLAAEGVRRIAVLSDHPEKHRGRRFPPGTSVHPRDEIDRVQRELRALPGVTALLYDQTCAAEARRLRKRGRLPEPPRRVVIHELVCEGCGDCSAVSNCIAVEPVETEFGRKRRINQSACNLDTSCLGGYCPSFVTLEGARPRRAAGGESRADTADEALFAALPPPAVVDLSRPVNVLVCGIGGSGVVTVGALLGMAAHLEGRGCSVLDVTGLAQKNGPVTSHVRIAARPQDLGATRIARSTADLLLACDLVVATAPENLARLAPGRSLAVVNRDVAPTAEFARQPDLDLSPARMEEALRAATGPGAAHFVEATSLATALLGDAVAANVMLLGHALQLGRLPVSLAALERAIELNGRAVTMNRRALAWGRLLAVEPEAVLRAACPALPEAPRCESLEDLVVRRAAFLAQYQNEALGRRYAALVERVREAEAKLGAGTRLAEATARAYFKLLACKDEYEVARLYTDGEFRRRLEREFEGEFRVRVHLAPQIANRRDAATGRARKLALGAWVFPLLAVLARLRFLRGTPLDPFGWTAHRRLERRLIGEYEARIAELLAGLRPETHELAVEIAGLPEQVRGFDLVKERSLEKVREKERELLAAFQRCAAPVAAPRASAGVAP
jgi:indolepyruvate ferredoxin oxidoreductase